MSDIDEIALKTVKAIGNIDPDKLPGGRTQAIAQAQILVRDAIEKQLEQAQARVAELESAATQKRIDALNSAFILRKQAEAVEAFAKDEGMSWPTTLARGLAAAAKQYAQRLRNQADEAERAGGEK